MISLLIFISCLTHTFAIKCYVDNQGIPVEEADGIIAEFKVSITWGEKSYIQSIFSEVRNMPLKQKVCTPGIRLQPGRWKTPKLPKGDP